MGALTLLVGTLVLVVACEGHGGAKWLLCVLEAPRSNETAVLCGTVVWCCDARCSEERADGGTEGGTWAVGEFKAGGEEGGG